MVSQTLHYTDHAGAEPAMVFIHGFTCDGGDWENQIQWCRDNGRRAITVDLRGHGRSRRFESGFDAKTMGGDVVDVLRTLGVESAVAVGHSMGCRVASETALQAPDIVEGAALVDGGRLARGDPEEAVESGRAAVELAGFAESVQSLFGSMFLPGADENRKRRILERAQEMPPDIGTELYLSILRWDAAEFERRYKSLSVPVQIIQSMHRDESRQMIPVAPGTIIDWHNDIVSCGVDAEFELVTDCGHFTMIEAPDEVNASLERLLDRTKKDEQTTYKGPRAATNQLLIGAL
ncbi:hypothetical protein ACHAWF_014968 [Thalassiosira exigua]